MIFAHAVLAGLLAAVPALGHVTMEYPPPFGNPTSDPIKRANFPCQNGRSSAGGTAPVTDITAGSTLHMTFLGSAVHNGGSCQIAISLDSDPTASSEWKVIHTVQGGCPALTGEAAPIDLVMPPSVPSGKVALAWTWFPVSSGGAEMYMNCAVMNVEGGASDDTAFKALPDLLQANLDDTCIAYNSSGGVVAIPNPGDSVDTRAEGTYPAVAPSGTGCGSTVSGTPSGTATGTATGSSTSTATGSATGSATDSTTSTASGSASGSGTPIGSSTGTATSTATGTATGTGTQTVSNTMTTSTSTGTATGSSSSAASATPSGGATACTGSGLMCMGETKFGLCDFGSVSIWQDVAPGTKCVDNAIVKA